MCRGSISRRCTRRCWGCHRKNWRKRQQAADLTFLHEGITFTVYGSKEGRKKFSPYDLVPTDHPFQRVDEDRKGTDAAADGTDMFLRDIYHEGRILPKGLVTPVNWFTAARIPQRDARANVPRDVYVSVAGRTWCGSGRELRSWKTIYGAQRFFVHAANRKVLKRVFPTMFPGLRCVAVDH